VKVKSKTVSLQVWTGL